MARPKRKKFVENGGQEFDGDNHVHVLAPAFAALLQDEGADAEELAVLADEGGPAPEGVGGGGEDRVFQEVFPVAGELLAAGDLGGDGVAAAPGGGEDNGLAETGGGAVAQVRSPGRSTLAERLDEAETGFLVVSHGMARRRPGHRRR